MNTNDPILTAYHDHDDIFLQSVEDLLGEEKSSCDFEALGILRLIDLGREKNMDVDIDTGEDWEDHELMKVFQRLYYKNRKKINDLIKRQRILIEEEEFTEENDKEFRDIGPKIDRIVKVCAKTIDRICERTLNESVVSLDF